MKFRISLLMLFIFSACQQRKKETKSPEPPKKFEMEISKLYGVWVETESILSFRNSTSPADLRSTHGIDLTISDTSTLTWGYHEGISLVLGQCSQNKLNLTCIANPKDLSLTLDILNDTTLVCHNCNGDTAITLRKFSDLKTDKNSECSCSGLPCYFRQKYFTGKFLLSEYGNGGSESEKVEFKSCQIEGFRDFDQYNIIFDDYGSFTNLDLIELVKTDTTNYTKSEFAYYHFKISKDSIYFYDFDPPYDSIVMDTAKEITDAKIGKLKFVLEKYGAKSGNHP